jgi:hypothetical protein
VLQVGKGVHRDYEPRPSSIVSYLTGPSYEGPDSRVDPLLLVVMGARFLLNSNFIYALIDLDYVLHMYSFRKVHIRACADWWIAKVSMGDGKPIQELERLSNMKSSEPIRAAS